MLISRGKRQFIQSVQILINNKMLSRKQKKKKSIGFNLTTNFLLNIDDVLRYNCKLNSYTLSWKQIKMHFNLTTCFSIQILKIILREKNYLCFKINLVSLFILQTNTPKTKAQRLPERSGQSSRVT